MKSIINFLSLAAVAAAQFNFNEWVAAGTDDLRGPCPGLNALANHGFIPHDGRNITQAALIKAVTAVNMSTEIAGGLFAAALTISSDPASGAFTLEDLSQHNLLEHDASLSRPDAGTSNDTNQSFDATTYEEFKSFFGGATQVTLDLAAAARWGRIQSSKASNPDFTYGAGQRFNSYAESALYFRVLQNGTTGTAPVEWLDVLFKEERLPVNEGWTTPGLIEGLKTANVILTMAIATEEKASDLVTPSTTKRSFSHLG